MSQLTQTHRTPTSHYTTLIVAIFPLAIYFFQLLGKVSSFAAGAAGVLVVLKVIVELHHHHAAPRSSRPAPAPALIQVEAPIAGCYLCQELRHLRPSNVGGHRVGICQRCHHCLSFTNQCI